MTNWYKDIYPCDACTHQGILKHRCTMKHTVTHVDGCKDCGTMVNSMWYYLKEKCPDVDQRHYNDPSGS